MKDHAVIVLQKEGKVLFVQRAATKKSLPNIWAFPSGTMEEGESPESTVIREAKEELQQDVQVDKVFSVIELPELGVKLHFVLCKSASDTEVVFDPNEIQAIKWLAFEEFFAEFTDEQIGHGLIYLRKHPEIWKEL